MSSLNPEIHTCPTLPASLGRPTSNGSGGPRIALYSHDTQGLGHVRRNLLISRALCRGGATPVILLLSGLREATSFEMPRGVDCVTLPSLGKALDGSYYPRSLDVPMADLIQVRTETITAVLKSFDPDLLIVDKVPRGVFDELIPGLDALKTIGRARIVLGLRDVLDDPDAVRREWAEQDYESTIRAYYDRIWIYGDRDVYDTVTECNLPPDIGAMTRFTGYLNPLDASSSDPANPPEYVRSLPTSGGPLTLCLVGGGRDGLPLAEAFLRARLPGPGVLITGPLMPEKSRAALRAMGSARPSIRVLEFITDPCPLLARADRVISMGGYNTMCEILAFGKSALIVPRTKPRTEQLIRAMCLEARGLVDVLRPDDLAPEALSRWLEAPPSKTTRPVDFDGVSRLPAMVEELLSAHASDKEPVHAES